MHRALATSRDGSDPQDARCRGTLRSQRQRDSTHFGWSASQSEAYCWPWTRQEVNDICSSDGLSSWHGGRREQAENQDEFSHVRFLKLAPIVA